MMKKNIILSLALVLLLVVNLGYLSAEHTMPSDLVDSDTGLLEGMGTWANNVTQGIFWTLMLAGFCVVLFMSTVRYDVPRAFGYASTAGLFGSFLLAVIGWIPWGYASIFLVVGAVGLALMVKSK